MDKKKRNRTLLIVTTVIAIIILLLLLVKCSSNKPKQEVIKEETTTEVTKPIDNTQDNKQEEVIIEPTTPVETEAKDITNMYFWVVFYDQYGNELQREALKYGTVPTFKGTLPEGFDKWNKTVKSITGNTYYKAICHEVQHTSSGSGSNPAPTPSEPNYLWFKCIGTNDTSIYLKDEGGPSFDAPNLEYSSDKETWYPINVYFPIEIWVGDTVYIRATDTNTRLGSFDGYNAAYYHFASENTEVANALEVGGSIMTLLDPTGTNTDISGKDGCFYCLFDSMENLTKADSLVCPAQTLAPYCYCCLLANCTNLKSVNPNLLPAMNLSGCDGCYQDLFNSDSSLENVPNLPAIILAPNCYYTMFCNNTSLESVPSGLLPATDLSGCGYCYSGMFTGCTSLTTAPHLLASTLSQGCYSDMFYDCNALTGLTVSFSDFDESTSPTTYTSNWVCGIDNNFGVFKWPGSTSGVTRDIHHVPPNWSISN